MPLKRQSKDFKAYPKIYWISIDNDDYSKNQSKFTNREGIYKISKFSMGNDEKEFINLNLTCELTQDEFNKFSNQINKYLGKEFKVFYKFADIKYTYTPNINLNDMKNAIINFIDDKNN